VLINSDAEKCRELVHNILKAERLKATRRVFLHDFVRGLIGYQDTNEAAKTAAPDL